MRHTSHWFESDERGEWPLSENATEEEAPQEDALFDYNAKPDRFYMEVETDGSMGPREVILKVRVTHSSYARWLNFMSGTERAADKVGRTSSRFEISG